MAPIKRCSYTLAALFFAIAANAQMEAGSEGPPEGGSKMPANYEKVVMAHGIMMGLAFALLFPLGAIVLRAFKGQVWFHAGWQVFAYVLALAAFGMGVWMAVESDQLNVPNGHPVIGIIVIGVLFFQPIGGYLAHQLYVKKQRATWVHVTHRWIGRIFLILGAINGGLGLQLSGNTTKGEIAYGVVAAFFFALWLAVAVYDHYRTKRSGQADLRGEKLEETRLDEHDR